MAVADMEPNGAGAAREPREFGGMPPWVKLFLIIGVALALLFVTAKLTGVGGNHGPGRHGGGGSTPTSAADHQPPVGHRP